MASADDSEDIGDNANNCLESLEYYGYEPKSPQDFPFDEDKPLDHFLDGKLGQVVDPNNLHDQARSSKVLYFGMTFVTITTIVLFAWFFFIGGAGECKVQQLCDTRDRSSYVASAFTPSKFEFLVPTKLLWISMLCASFGLLVAACQATALLKRRVGTCAMAEIANHIREASQIFLSRVLLREAVPIIVIFILLAVGPGWRVAGSFAIGSLLSMTTSYLNSQLTLSANVRTSGAALIGVPNALESGLQTGAVIGLVVASLGLVGLSSSYLMFQDVRALAGFALGASVSALLSRIVGSVFSKAADIGADSLVGRDNIMSEDHPQNPAVIADITGDIVDSIYSGTADCFSSFAASIAATALLGSSLPFFQRNQYAMCVFNHLYVDNRCGYFGYPQQLSYASFICKTNDFYLKYPRLTVWQSNAAFVAFPFLLASVGLLASVVATAFYGVLSKKVGDNSDKKLGPAKLMRIVHASNIMAAVLVVCGSAALCFLMFGASSSFQEGSGLGSTRNLPVFTLSSDEKACVNTFLLPESSNTSVPLPSGTFSDNGRYEPLSTLGFKYGQARHTPWRLFGCIIIGLILGLLTNAIAAYFTTATHAPVRAAARSEMFGTGALVIQGLGMGMMSTSAPMILVVASFLGSYNLFGFYGIAVSSVALLSTLGVSMSAIALGALSDSALGIVQMCRPALPAAVRNVSRALSDVGSASHAIGKSFSNVSAVLTACAVLAALVNESALTPAPRILVGTPRVLGRVVQATSTLSDTYVIASLFIGFLVPFVLTGLILTSVHSLSQSVIFEAKQQQRQNPLLRSSDVGSKPDYNRCVHSLTNLAVIEVVIPATAVIMTPLIVGFGFGQRSLVGALLSTISSSYLLSTTMIHSGEAWDTVKKLSTEHREDNAEKSITTSTDSVLSGDVVGDVFKDTAGPCLNVYINTATVVGLVSVSLMQSDGDKGWIGGLIMACFVLFGTLYGLWSVRHLKEHRAQLREDEGSDTFGEILPPPKKVSPFYVDTCTWGADNVVPGSQMHDALYASEQSQTGRDPQSLPGLSDRTAIDREKLNSLKNA